MIREAHVHDVPAMGEIINGCAEYGLMLHRSQAYLYEHVREFHVADEGGAVVGVCGLTVVWANLAEVYALAVTADQRGRGVGKRLVEASVEQARRLGIRKLMTLTYETEFFGSCGFSVVDRQTLPLKVWSDCVGCSKNQACDEVAMIHVLEDVPEAATETSVATAGTDDGFEVPVTLGVLPRRLARRQKMDEAP